MYIPGKGRYNNYTSRFDVYLFTLRDFTEMINTRFGGTYIERSDMPIHSGYLLKFVDASEAIAFIEAAAIETTKDGDITTLVLPATDGNELPVYATIKKCIDVVYIGLSEFKDALNDQVPGQIDAPVLKAEDPNVEMFGYHVSDLQSNVSVSDDAITGTLKYLSSGQLVTRWGAGNFLAIKLEGNWNKYNSVQVGMVPSHGDGLVEIIDDPDKDGAFKVTDKDEQVFRVVATNGVETVTKDYALSGLTLLSE